MPVLDPGGLLSVALPAHGAESRWVRFTGPPHEQRRVERELPPPEVIAREIVDDLQAALLEFSAVADALEEAAAERGTLTDN